MKPDKYNTWGYHPIQSYDAGLKPSFIWAQNIGHLMPSKNKKINKSPEWPEVEMAVDSSAKVQGIKMVQNSWA